MQGFGHAPNFGDPVLAARIWPCKDLAMHLILDQYQYCITAPHLAAWRQQLGGTTCTLLDSLYSVCILSNISLWLLETGLEYACMGLKVHAILLCRVSPAGNVCRS